MMSSYFSMVSGIIRLFILIILISMPTFSYMWLSINRCDLHVIADLQRLDGAITYA